MKRVALLTACFVVVLTGCSTTGHSAGGVISAPNVVQRPTHINPELAPYAPRFFRVLASHGFKVGMTSNRHALHLVINFNPDLVNMAIGVKLIGPNDHVVASVDATNHGWGTLLARQTALQNLVTSAVNNFSAQLSKVTFRITQDRDNYAACLANLKADTKLAPLRNKVALGSVRDQDFSMLANNARPSESEKPLILLWGKKREACMRMKMAELKRADTPEPILHLHSALDTTSQVLVVQLYEGRLTYGTYAQKRQTLGNEGQAAHDKIIAQLRQESETTRYRAKRLAIQAHRNFLQLQRNINQKSYQNQQLGIERQQLFRSSSSTTRCNVLGSTITCNSQ